MGLITAAVATFAAVGSYMSTRKGQKEANALNEKAQGAEREARSEQGALNAQRSAQERRQQVREERIARGKLMQGSENTGTSGSSGESGAGAGLAAQLGANIGFNLGQIQGTNNISALSQTAADFRGGAQKALSDAQTKAGGFQLVSSIFSNAGSFK